MNISSSIDIFNKQKENIYLRNIIINGVFFLLSNMKRIRILKEVSGIGIGNRNKKNA